MASIGEQRTTDGAGRAATQAEPVVSVRGLVKRYGSHEAVAGIDLDVRRGEVFAFLGPNGAGKTTTVEILSWVTIACSHRPFLVRGSPVRLS